MTLKAGSHLYLGHHWPDGRDGIEIRVYADLRGYYASTVYDPAGSYPPDIGPFPTSFEAASAGAARHFVEFDPPGPAWLGRAVAHETPSVAMAM